LSLLLAKLASSTSPQKPPATYTQVNDFGPHTIFRRRLIRESDLYASIYGKLDLIVVLIVIVIGSPASLQLETFNQQDWTDWSSLVD